MVFHDRQEAGRKLAAEVRHRGYDNPVVLGLPRGGVPVAFEVARELDAPLDVIIVRKLGAPAMPEVAVGAIGEGGSRVVDPRTKEEAGVTDAELDRVEARERESLAHRVSRLRGDHPVVPLTGRSAIIVDDGIATGSTARAACRIARDRGAERVVMAAPVGPSDVVMQLSAVADEVVCPDASPDFAAVGQFYVDFAPTSDAEVVELLDRAHRVGPGRTS